MVTPGPQIRNIVTAALPNDAQETQIIDIFRSLLQQLHSKERRCVLTLDDRNAILREVQFPPMSRSEQKRAAKIETERFAPSAQPCITYSARANAQRYVLGATEQSALDRLLRIAHAVKLRVVAVDHAGYALRRAYPEYDAIIDVGLQITRFYAYGEHVPFSLTLDMGGTHFTQAIARSFAIDGESAEGRKRMHGIASAGESEVAAIVHFVGRAMRAARTAGVPDIERILLTGNGARCALLQNKIERDTGCIVESATRISNCTMHFPEDIVRAAAPDWGLACGSALWSLAEEVAAA